MVRMMTCAPAPAPNNDVVAYARLATAAFPAKKSRRAKRRSWNDSVRQEDTTASDASTRADSPSGSSSTSFDIIQSCVESDRQPVTNCGAARGTLLMDANFDDDVSTASDDTPVHSKPKETAPSPNTLLLDMNFDDIELNSPDTLLLDMIFDDDDDDDCHDRESSSSGRDGTSPDMLLMDMKFDSDDSPSPDTLLLDMKFQDIQKNRPDTLLLDMDFDDDDAVSSDGASIEVDETAARPLQSTQYPPRTTPILYGTAPCAGAVSGSAWPQPPATSMQPVVLGTSPAKLPSLVPEEHLQGTAMAVQPVGENICAGPIAVGVVPTTQQRLFVFAPAGNASQQQSQVSPKTSPAHGGGPLLVGTSPTVSPCSASSRPSGYACQWIGFGSMATSPAAMGSVLVGTCQVSHNGSASQPITAETLTTSPTSGCGSAVGISAADHFPVWNTNSESPMHGDDALKSWLCGEGGPLPCSSEIAARLLAAAPEAYED
eukprot:gnl/TRDRNA2_/TRDRNA2_179088_c0_seq1.p1 gnl/TRDRNA2_/TRDRNA2_179088_c0~~gnl/TRDRNA2_/TRDRNA2_179088_c0_seq1.p1  ORF type:complete len:487 (-),score=78.76 gnl/TRDRNA2_/TRDRNA2_179088_c0_seq1:438-1898(-)